MKNKKQELRRYQKKQKYYNNICYYSLSENSTTVCVPVYMLKLQNLGNCFIFKIKVCLKKKPL